MGGAHRASVPKRSWVAPIIAFPAVPFVGPSLIVLVPNTIVCLAPATEEKSTSGGAGASKPGGAELSLWTNLGQALAHGLSHPIDAFKASDRVSHDLAVEPQPNERVTPYRPATCATVSNGVAASGLPKGPANWVVAAARGQRSHGRA
jgi:hypothetical protein